MCVPSRSHAAIPFFIPHKGMPEQVRQLFRFDFEMAFSDFIENQANACRED